MRFLGIAVALVAVLACIWGILRCSTGSVDQLADAKDSAISTTRAIEGEPIDTSGGDERPDAGGSVVEKPSPPEEDSGGLELPDPGIGEPAEPIKGPLTMDDLVYPVQDPRTGKQVKHSVGDVDDYSTTTTDPFLKVWFYYSQILQGRQQEIEDNVSRDGVEHYAVFRVRDGGKLFVINIREESLSGPTSINISKK